MSTVSHTQHPSSPQINTNSDKINLICSWPTAGPDYAQNSCEHTPHMIRTSGTTGIEYTTCKCESYNVNYGHGKFVVPVTFQSDMYDGSDMLSRMFLRYSRRGTYYFYTPKVVYHTDKCQYTHRFGKD